MGARDIEIIVVGGSAGALEVLAAIVPALPREFAVPLAIVLHLPPAKPSYLAEILAPRCALPVKEAEDKEPASPGTVYLAPPNYHLLVEPSGHFSLSADDPVNFSRPAVDVLFESAAFAYRRRAAGVILTGASADGAKGLARIKNFGGLAYVQSPETSLVSTMPKAALRLVQADQVLAPVEVGPLLARLGAPEAEGVRAG